MKPASIRLSPPVESKDRRYGLAKMILETYEDDEEMTGCPLKTSGGLATRMKYGDKKIRPLSD